MIRCEELPERAADYLYGLLPDWQMEEIAAHTGRCDNCRQAIEKTAEDLRRFDAWEVPELEADTCPEFMRRLRLHETQELVPWDAALEREPLARGGPLARVSGLIQRWRALPTGTKIAVSSISLLSVALLAVALVVVIGQHSGRAQAERGPRPLQVPEAAMVRPGLRVWYSEGNVDEALVGALADVASVAKRAIEEVFPDRSTERINLLVSRGYPWRESVVTDRANTIYVLAGNQGIGENMRADAGPVAMMCEAVAELYNSRRLPGFERFVSHRYLVPAVIDEVGPFPIQLPNATALATDGPEMLDLITSDEYTLVHPDFAAVAALRAVEQALGRERFAELLDQVSPGTQEPFAVLRAAAIRADAALEPVFAAYDEATRLEPDEEGSYLVASFEPDEAIQAVRDHPLRTMADTLSVVVAPDVDWQLTDEDATHGTRSLRLQLLRDSEWMHANLIDPDWQFKDLRRFSELSMDVRVESATPQHVAIDLHDEVNCGHGLIAVFSAEVRPGGWQPIVYRFDQRSLKGRKDWTAFYFDGAFRPECVSRLHIRVWEPKLPVTLYVDNLRLVPRELETPADEVAHAAIHQPTPVPEANLEHAAAAEASYARGLALKGAGRFQEAAEALRQALAAAPDHAEAHWALAWVLIELKDQEGAKQKFRRVIELAPGSEQADQAQKALERLGG